MLYTLKYEDWSPLGASFVLKVGYKVQGGTLLLEALLYDIPGTKKIFGTRYQFPAAQYPKLVHALTEDILKALTGERGLFSSRIVMACHDKRRKNPPKDIYVIEPDGRNMVRLTNDNTLTLTPSWSPDGKHVTYSQFEFRLFGRVRKKGIVFKEHNLQTGERTVLAALEGMSGKGAWSPVSGKIAVTLSYTGRPELYLLDPNNPGGTPDPLSERIQWHSMSGVGFQSDMKDLLFEVEPSWSPDGKKLVFSSRRTGHPNIYIVEWRRWRRPSSRLRGLTTHRPPGRRKGTRSFSPHRERAKGTLTFISSIRMETICPV